MSYSEDAIIGLVSGSSIVVGHALIAWKLWGYPLNHGLGYFLATAVPPGYYDGPGQRWLRRYRALLVAQCLLVFSVFAAVLVSGRWSRMPTLALVGVTSFLAMFGGFTLWARHAVGAVPATLSRVVVPLETRRLADYISWPAEALMAAIVTAGWLVAARSPAPFQWTCPVLTTYIVLALLPGKIILVRNSFPLPPERTEEYHRWLEVWRRYSLRMMDAMRWFVVAVLAGYAAQRGWPGPAAMPWIRWASLAVMGAIFAAMMTIVLRGNAQVAAMGRDLRPMGSFQSPFRPASMFVRGGRTWGIAYTAGLAALLIYFVR